MGVLGGLAGLAAMQAAYWLTKPVVKKRVPRGTAVFATERSVSPVGIHHRPDEGTTDALARISYEKILRRPPSPRVQRALSLAIHVGYGVLAGGAFAALRHAPRHAVRDGALFGAALWLVGTELAAPLLGLADKPTAYHPTRHVQTLLQHLGYGVATVTATRALEERWS